LGDGAGPPLRKQKVGVEAVSDPDFGRRVAGL